MSFGVGTARHAAHRSYSPSALGGSFYRFWSLALMLAKTEFKLRFFGSVLGYFWSLARPMLLFGVTLFVFTDILQINKDSHAPHYAEYLLQSIILFTFFQEATAGAVPSLVAREGILRRVRFPRMAIPFSVALNALFNLCLNMIVVIIFILASGISPRLSWLEMPVMIMFLVVLSTGVAMLLSALYVRFRDMQPIWEVLIQVIYYGSPIIYTFSTAQQHSLFGIPLSKLLQLNPLALVFTQARRAMLEPKAPSAIQAFGGTAHLLIPIGITALIFLVGLWYFSREAPLIAEKL